MAFSVQSKACCTRPPIVLRGGYEYQEKGRFENFNGMKTCKPQQPLKKRFIQRLIGWF